MNVRSGIVLVFGAFIFLCIIGAFLGALNQRRLAPAGADLPAGNPGPPGVPELRGGREEAADAFNDPAAPAPEEAAEFVRVLARFSDAVRDEDGAALLDLYDPDRLFDELVRLNPSSPVLAGPGARAGFAAGMRGAGRQMILNPLLRWDSTRVRRVRWSADRAEAVVVASHRRTVQVLGGEAPLTLKMRWWFVRRDGGWRLYDFEDLDGGVRMSSTMAALMAPGFEGRAAQVRAAVAGLRDAQVALLKGDMRGLDAGLARARGVALPAPIEAAAVMLEAFSLFAAGEEEAALKALDRAGELNPDMPVRLSLRATWLNATGDHAGALAAADRYVAQLGPDADIDHQRGLALKGLDRPAEAAAAFGRALDDAPDYKDAFEGLRASLPAGGKAPLADRLARAPDPADLFDHLTEAARGDGDAEAVAALERGLRRAVPGDPRGVTAEVRRLAGAGAFAEAAGELLAGLGAVPADARPQVLNAYLYAMLAADRPLDAYAAVPGAHAAAAFRTLAGDLEDGLDEFDPADPPAAARRLRDLIAAHRGRSPGDPWLGFHEAALFQASRRYEEAERAFAAAGAEYSRTAPPPPAGEKDWQADVFRYRRVRCLYQARQGLGAYQDVGPAADTFAQLAAAFDADGDPGGLAALIAAHRERSPGDAQLAYWSAQIQYSGRRYRAAADGFRAFLRAAGEREPNRWLAADHCVRGYLRADRPGDAREAVAGLGDLVSPGLRAAVALAGGRAAEAEAVLAGLAEREFELGFVYSDEDFARLVARPEFAALREKYPDPRPKKPPRTVD